MEDQIFFRFILLGYRGYMYICVDCVSELADNTLEASFLANQCLNVMFPTTKQQ